MQENQEDFVRMINEPVDPQQQMQAQMAMQALAQQVFPLKMLNGQSLSYEESPSSEAPAIFLTFVVSDGRRGG